MSSLPPVKEPMRIIVNGKSCPLPRPRKLAEIVSEWLEQGNEDPQTVMPYAVCINDEHVPREHIDSTTLNAGDVVELFTVRQGG